MSEQANIYDEESMSFLKDVAGWIQNARKATKIDYKSDLQANLLPTMLRMFEVLSTRINEVESVVMEQLEENTLQPELANAILAAFALAEEAFKSALVSTENEAVKKFRAAVAELTPQIQEAVIEEPDDVEEDEEEEDETNADGTTEEETA